MARNKEFAAALTAAGLDLNKNYYSLCDNDLRTVEKIRKMFNYSGRNYLGRLPREQFWYAAQRGRK